MQFHIKRHREEEDIILIPEILNFGTCAVCTLKSFFERKIGQLQHGAASVPFDENIQNALKARRKT